MPPIPLAWGCGSGLQHKAPHGHFLPLPELLLIAGEGWVTYKGRFFRHDHDPGAFRPLPEGEGTKNLRQQDTGWEPSSTSASS